MGDERSQQIDKVLVHRGTRLAIARGPRSGARPGAGVRVPGWRASTRGRAGRLPPPTRIAVRRGGPTVVVARCPFIQLLRSSSHCRSCPSAAFGVPPAQSGQAERLDQSVEIYPPEPAGARPAWPAAHEFEPARLLDRCRLTVCARQPDSTSGIGPATKARPRCGSLADPPPRVACPIALKSCLFSKEAPIPAWGMPDSR